MGLSDDEAVDHSADDPAEKLGQDVHVGPAVKVNFGLRWVGNLIGRSVIAPTLLRGPQRLVLERKGDTSLKRSLKNTLVRNILKETYLSPSRQVLKPRSIVEPHFYRWR